MLPEIENGLLAVPLEASASQESITRDPKSLLARILPPLSDQSYPMLASIDPYGDTTFNRVPMPKFLAEWSIIGAKAQSSEEPHIGNREHGP